MKLRKTAASAAVVSPWPCRHRLRRQGGHRRRQAGRRRRTRRRCRRTTVAKDVKLDSPVLKKAQKRGKLIIGAKADQPYLGLPGPLHARSTPASTSRSPRWSPPTSASTRRRDPVQDDRLRRSARPRSPRARSTTTSAPTRSTTSARSRSASRARTTWPARTCWSARTRSRSTARTASRARRSARSSARPRSRTSRTARKYGAETSRVRQVLALRQAAARRPGRRRHHRRRDPQGLRRRASHQAQGRRQAFTEEPYGIGLKKDDKALRTRIIDAARGAPEERRLQEGVRRDARPVRLEVRGAAGPRARLTTTPR